MPDSLTLAEEQSSDIPAVDHLITAAFGQPAEEQLVQSLRRNGGLTLSAVARLAGQPVAHVGYSPLKIGGHASSPPALALAPVSVAPEHQRRGYGSALIRWSLERLKEGGCPAVIVLGESGFYSRFGFRRASDFRIECPYDVPGEYYMALELHAGALGGMTGLVEYRPEFSAVE
jgi:putative acetyltransferase